MKFSSQSQSPYSSEEISPGAGVVTVEIELAGGELVEAKSISNLAFKVPPTVVKDSDAKDPAALAC